MVPGACLHEGNISSGLWAGELPARGVQKQPALSALPRAHLWLALPACSLEGSLSVEIWPTSLILSTDMYFLAHMYFGYFEWNLTLFMVIFMVNYSDPW